MQNAILGGNVDLSGLQPFQIENIPTDFFQQQTPMNIQAQAQAQQNARNMGPIQGGSFTNFNPEQRATTNFSRTSSPTSNSRSLDMRSFK